MRSTKHIITLLLAILTVFSLSLAVSADESTVTLRIEGISENLYYSEIELGEARTVADIIAAADNASDAITVTGADSGYITDINGESASQFGGWDGWMYRVNNTEPSVSMGDYAIKAGDVIVVYYSDAYGVGMQYPAIDASDIGNGVIAFTSMDTTYDASYNATVTENPVAGMTVIFDKTEYVTDDNGRITVDASLLTAGEHRIAISKIAENGAPAVLRLAPDATVIVPEPTPDEPATDSKPGDATALALFVIIAAAALAGIAIVIKTRK